MDTTVLRGEAKGERDEIAFIYPSGGMNGAGLSEKIGQNQYRRAVNVTLVDELPTTRPPLRVIPLESNPAGQTEFWAVNNLQGAKFHNPTKGQGGFALAESAPMVLCACGGQKFTIRLTGVGTATTATLSNISNGILASANFHLVWWGAWENYALAQDGSAACFIWDGKGNAFLSTGYRTDDKPNSTVPNGGTVMAYAHARGVVVVNSRLVLVGDSLHRTDQSTASNLLAFVEQVYWATGQFFLPPSAMGNITAAEILPLKNTQHGHGELMLHCEDGIFSLDLNVYPRSTWANTQMTKHAILGAGATGPYCLVTYDGDQFFRTKGGITDLRSAAADSQVEGNPNMPLSEPVATWLNADQPEWLRFCSMAPWEKNRRLLCTIDPTLDGRFRWHRGIVVRNFNPVPAERSEACWEGIWTLPPQCAGIVQLITGTFDAERALVLARGSDGRNRLGEFLSYSLGYDTLEDGSHSPIACQLITRALDLSQPLLEKEFRSGTLFLRNVTGRLEWGVWFRALGKTEWQFWRAGTVEVADSSDEIGLNGCEPFTGGIALGDFPKSCANAQGNARSFEFLIRWNGYAQIESLRIIVNPGDTEAEKVDDRRFKIVKRDPLAGGYDDFEYPEGNVWSISQPVSQ